MKTGKILMVIIILCLGGGLIFSIHQNKSLNTKITQDSTSLHEKDSIIRDYANINLYLRNVVSKSSSLENEVTNDTAYVNISSKYN